MFLDRDGTLLELVHHLSDPSDVRLVTGAAKAVRALRAAGYLVVVVTNQSVLGRGIIDEARLDIIHAEIHRQLADRAAAVDAIYYCPVAPSGTDRRVVEHVDRKPGPGMLFRAAADFGIDLASSVMIGDMVSDGLAGRNAGCSFTILVLSGHGHRVDEDDPAFDYRVPDLPAAAALVLDSEAAHPVGEPPRV